MQHITTSKKKNIDENIKDVYNDDIVIEENENIDSKIKKLKGRLNKCLKENKENLLGWQRSRADFVNAKKENEDKIKDSFVYAKGEFLEELLPVVDSFEMAFANKDAWEKVDKDWRIGVEYIYTQFLSILKNNGVKQIDPVDEKFNPSAHISMDTIEVDKKKKDGVVVNVIQKGYEHNGKIIRAAKVIVSRYKK